MPTIIITIEEMILKAELNVSETARAVWDNLPLEGIANVWGDEIYFSIPFLAGTPLL